MLVVVAVSAVAAAGLQGPPGNREDQITGAAATGDAEHTVTFVNDTGERIWVGSVASTDDGSIPLTGLPTLDPGRSATVTVPERSGAGHWRGRFFARQGCTGEEGSTFHCAVGDCGPYADRCDRGAQPVSLAEFNFDTADPSAPWYNVSYVDAVSVPITITPDGVPPPADGGECAQVGCNVDLLSACPPENLTRDAAGKPLVCINPHEDKDRPTAYSDALVERCPMAYSWSKLDHQRGNQVMRQCSNCTGMTVAFHGSGTGEGSGTGDDSEPADKTKPRAPERPDAPKGRTAPLKGAALNPVDGTHQSAALTDSGVSWYHNWTSSSGGVVRPEGVEYVPTIWGPGSVNETELNNAAREGKNLLTFNEPDLRGQANMTVEQALDLWPQLEKTGLRLGAPAVAANADKPRGWLDRFMKGAEKRGLRVDFIPVHWYGSDFSYAATYQLADYLQRIHDRYKKPIWLTEYALTDFTEGTPRYPSEEEQTQFIKTSTESLGVLPFVKRYAWFALFSTEDHPTGLYDGTTPNASGTIYRNAG
ncbi:glycosyl hydrolase [Streptomyces sp. WMMC500]|uniref:glycosyl hydrolase n=1 Tax=Streptomyces sp. WMMC500 TaxID=3015154 RepID=UPI00248BD38E|nr:glycosyl hydrolase [Streptomyces sp. WMMC500]WBB58513.1 glycosyl hydrolase [Streptomyces sp. WMMC500]